MKFLKDWVAGKVFEKDFLVSDGWGLWARAADGKKFTLIGLRSKYTTDCFLLVDSTTAGRAAESAAYSAAESTAYSAAASDDSAAASDDSAAASDAYSAAESAAYRATYNTAYAQWWIDYYQKLGIFSVWPKFPKAHLEQVAIELDYAMEHGEPVNGELLAYILKETK